MRLAAEKFLEKPSEKFFFGGETEAWPREKIIEELKKREFIAIQAEFPKKILSDLVWGQLRRYLRKAATHLEENDFTVKKADLWSDEEKVFFMYELVALELEKRKKIIGPNALDAENVNKFLTKKRKTIGKPKIENGRMVLIVERENTSAKKALKEHLTKCQMDEKEGIKLCLKHAEVLEEKEILKHYKGHFAEHLTKYLEGKESFE
jgi:tRNA nucleotidyltransferase (CCA-adding enzyme)